MSRIYSRFKTILASILISCIVLNLFPLSLLALDEPYYSVSEGYEFSITRVISSRWEDHANIDFTVTNNGDTTIDNWYITTSLPYEVENIWNASIAETSDNYITFSSAPQNQPIEPGCSVTFGITGYSENDSLFDMEPSFYLLNIEDVVIPVEKYQATTNVYSTTETGFSGAIAITNISSELLIIENVVLNSTNGLTINGNAAIEDETTLVVDSSSRNIYPNASIYINFEGTNEIPEVFELKFTGLAYTLTEDNDNDGILDIDEFLYPEGEPVVTPTPTIAPTNTPEVEEPTETPTVTPEEAPTATVTPSTTPEVEEPTPTPEITEEYLYQDDDSDGLLNGYEFALGYDIYNPDTDGDGISDIDEDYDQDGLTNGEEINLELNLVSNDTDFDLLPDYDEIYAYGTNPSYYDTDGDSVSDYDEVFLGKNPLVNDIDVLIPQEKSLELVSDELNGVNLATVNIDLADNISHQLQIRNVYNVDMYTSAIESLVSCPIDISCDEEFTEATITFTYVPELLDCPPEDLGILWYDEEHGFYIEQESFLDVENNTISTTVNHFSTYAVVSINEWWSAFDPDNAPNNTMIVEGTSSYITFSPNQVPPTIESREQDAFAWWKLTQDGQYRIVERLSGECRLREGTTGTYDYTYTWLVEDITDDDNDGLFDYYELNGILLSNGTLAFSSTNTDDSDGDGIGDSEEAGIGYRIERDANGRITVYANEQIVLSGVYYIDASSPYYYLNDYINTSSVTIENDLDFWVPISDPNNPDSDEDGVFDYEDASPLCENSDIVYIFYGDYHPSQNEELFTNEVNFRLRYYETRGIECESYYTDTVSSFIDHWNNMGMENSRVAHTISEVFILAHGLPQPYEVEDEAYTYYYIELSNGEVLDFSHVANLDKKTIGVIYLESCYGGTRYVNEETNEETPCMADFFLAYSDVGNVYACEGKSAAVKINDSTLVAFSTSFGSPGFYRFFYDEEGQRQREVVGILEWEL